MPILETDTRLKHIIQSLALAAALCLAGCVQKAIDFRSTPWVEQPESVPQILHVGWTSPDTIFLRQNIEKIEKRPFTGVVTWVSWPREEPAGRLTIKGEDRVYDQGRGVLSGRRLPTEAIEGAIRDLRATTFKKLKHNYIQCFFIASRGVKPDFWFDDGRWSVTYENFADLARVAKQGGCRGLFIDNETIYPNHFWSYPALKKLDPEFYADKTWEQTRDIARRRGRDVAAAINREFPDVTLYFMDTYSLMTGRGLINQRDLSRHNYMGLYMAFLDGILEGSTDETIIVDGNGNPKRHDVDRFAGRRARSLEVPIRCGLTQTPEQFAKKTRVGFGLYLAGRGPDWTKDDPRPTWRPEIPDKSLISPKDLEEFVRLGLQFGDGYLWTWNEYCCWWLDEGEDGPLPTDYFRKFVKWVPPVYWDAVERGVRTARDWPDHPSLAD
jgi:hypothetical protein